MPFSTVLAASQRYYQQRKKQHKKLTVWARQMMLLFSRWLPGRKIIIVPDSYYAVIELLDAVRKHVCVITRLRLDAALYKPAPPRPPGKSGPKRKKGDRLSNLEDLVDDPKTKWVKIKIPQWYGHGPKQMLIASGTAIGFHSGMPPFPIKWVLLKNPDGNINPAALLSTDLNLGRQSIINFFIRR